MEFIKKILKRIAAIGEQNQAEHDRWVGASQSSEDIKTTRIGESIEPSSKLEVVNTPSEVKVNYCSGCGVKQNEESNFCSSCGKSLESIAKPVEPNAEPLEAEVKPTGSEWGGPTWSELDGKGTKPSGFIKPKDEGWYQTRWVWFWLVLIWPVGLYGLIKRAEPEDQKKWWGGIAALFLMGLILGGGKSNQSPSSSSIAPFTTMEVCKGVIAQAFGRPVNIMSANSSRGIVHISYRRPDDNKTWRSSCKLEGNKGIWAMDGGRWRTHSMDSKITFEVVNGILYIKSVYGDGSSGQKVFRKSSF